MKKAAALSITLLLVSCRICSFGQTIEFSLKETDFDRQDFPLSINLPAGTISDGENVELLELRDRKKIRINSQYSFRDNELSWVVTGVTKAGEERQYQLKKTKKKNGEKLMGLEKTDSSLVITKGEKEILHYRYKELPAPAGQSSLYARSGFIHPLYSPSGECLTWAQPPDHFHHVGLWNPWTKVTWKGNHTDFWNLGTGLGTVRFREIISMESGPVYSEFRVMQDHIAFIPAKPGNDEEWNGEEVIVMEEEWRIRVWNIDDGYYLDFKSDVRNVLDEDISLDKYRYGGGIGYRATPEWNRENSSVLTSEGLDRKKGDATRAKWCWISGELGGKINGLLFMSDSTNFDYPQPMRIWPENSNGVGHQYFEFTPIREKDWIIEPGKNNSQYYRIWVREGELSFEEAERQWKQYIGAISNSVSILNR